MTLNDNWLGFGRWNEEFAATAAQVDTAGLYGPLRGVTEIEFGRLRRALRCTVTPFDGGYHVYDPKGREGVPEDALPGEFVNLDDGAATTRCYCEDFLLPGGARGEGDEARSGEESGRPCKHILAACLAHPEHRKQLEPFVRTMEHQDRVAAAAKKTVTGEEAEAVALAEEEGVGRLHAQVALTEAKGDVDAARNLLRQRAKWMLR